MHGVGELISSAFRLALVLAAMGQIKPVTLYLIKEAAKAQKHGLVSLMAINRSLGIAEPESKKPHH